jgi:hypothetical protein
MINEIKQIIDGYLNNRKPACLMIGTVISGGVKVSEKLTLPWEMVYGNLKDSVTAGQQVRLFRDDGGHAYYILEIIGYAPAVKDRTLQIEPITIDGTTISEIKIKDVVK